jgi:hypothetical protein
MTAAGSKPIYRLRLRSDSNCERDDIRYLKQLLKTLLRRYHLHAVSIEVEREQPKTEMRHDN